MRISILAFTLLAAAASCSAQTIVKGHHLGETVKEFLASDSAISASLNECRERAPKPITTDDLAKMSKRELSDMARSVTTFSIYGVSKKELAELAAGGKLFTPDRREYKDYCDKLVSIFEKGGKEYATKSAYDLDPAYGFTDGRLTFMYISLHGTFETAKADFTKRTGTEPVVTHPTYTNAYGAAWQDDVAIWQTPELFARLTARNNPAEQSLGLQISDIRLFDEEARRRAAQPNQLD